MSKIKLAIVMLVFGLAGIVYASTPTIQDKHANHGKAACCSAGAACCDGGACCAADKEHQACSTQKTAADGEDCCKPGAACCNGGACCEHKADGHHADAKPAKKVKSAPAKNTAADKEDGCCSGGACCSGGSCCAKHKS